MGYWKNRAEDVAHLKFVAQEYIKQQSPKKLNNLTEIIARFQLAGDYSQAGYDRSGISEWVFDNCGNTVSINNGADYGLADVEYAGVFPPSLDANSVIIPEFRKYQYQGNSDLEAYTKFIKENRLNGYFDNNDAKIEGELSKINSVIVLTKPLFTKAGLEPVELAAILLHEVGHIQQYFRTLMLTVIPNMVADCAANIVMGKTTDAEKISVIKDVEKMLNVKINEPEVIVKEYRKENIYTKLVTGIMLDRDSLTGSKGLDNRNWERMADEYAAKFGAASALASALYKLEMNSGVLFMNRSYRSYTAFMLMDVINIAALITVGVTGGPIGALVAGFGVTMGVMAADPEMTIYDPPEARFRTQRQFLINELRYFERLKGPKVKEERERCLAGIAAIDEILDKVNDKNGVFDLIFKHIIPSTRKQNRELEFQQALESFLSNDLAVAASKLKGKS